MSEITVIMPLRMTDSPEVAMRSLAAQTFQDFITIIAFDQGRGPSWAYNRAAESARSRFILVTNNDIEWRPDALERLYAALVAHPEASYAYGRYSLDAPTNLVGGGRFDGERLKRVNYIPGTSLIRRADWLPFRPEVHQHFNDWDLWLRMLKIWRVGVYVGDEPLFHTTSRPDGVQAGNLDAALADMRPRIREMFG